ncbi:hypothetical protein OO015_13600 [Thermomicrobium sp. 4228-Ro]|uniref:hypothetical protein n=1 Tax=Thermomicrobium sp. 4228-Ro TaxID=2993937 RepID=UPI0022493B1E|nr:hypothetical protein [Thermomicrobium sp. 4228-Ro]MCX2728520.1 hypothetical protein [Thermomicrobium sp. 4228-Ro]
MIAERYDDLKSPGRGLERNGESLTGDGLFARRIARSLWGADGASAVDHHLR